MVQIGLFSGVGGFELAGERMGWDVKVTCEINPFCQRVLKHYWPGAYCHGDIKTLDYGTIDDELSRRYGKGWRNGPLILTGGFPCQPFSLAGKRKGDEDDRHLWPEFVRVIRKLRPEYVVGENVPGLVNWDGGMVFEQVCSDLESEGYEVEQVLVPACGKDAPHKRERVWIVAHSASNRWEREREGVKVEEGLQEGSGSTGKLEGGFEGLCNDGTTSGSTNTRVEGMRGWEDEVHGQIPSPDTKFEGLEGGIGARGAVRPQQGGEEVVANTEGSRMEGNRSDREQEPQTRSGQVLFGCNNTRDYWKEWPTQPPLCSRDDGFSERLAGITFPKWRNESIKAMGNAIVPQVAYEIFKAIEETEKILNNGK
jgi:DNA (cytosine-5)-methyltransferase 1